MRRRSIFADKPRMTGASWRDISEDAKSFVASLLEKCDLAHVFDPSRCQTITRQRSLSLFSPLAEGMQPLLAVPCRMAHVSTHAINRKHVLHLFCGRADVMRRRARCLSANLRPQRLSAVTQGVLHMYSAACSSGLCWRFGHVQDAWSGPSIVRSRRDPKKRPSARDALQHPWLKGNMADRQAGKPISQAIVQRLQVLPARVRSGVGLQDIRVGAHTSVLGQAPRDSVECSPSRPR